MIRNKAQSSYEISERNLNRIEQETIFNKENLDELEAYLDKTNYTSYNMRDRTNNGGKFEYSITKKEVLEKSRHYTEFSVYESLMLMDEYLILQGEIEIRKDFTMIATLSDIKNISNRKAMENPIYNLNLDLSTDKEPYIRGLKQVIDYLCLNNLIGFIVEFSMFEKEVGTKKENIIIWELRNY